MSSRRAPPPLPGPSAHLAWIAALAAAGFACRAGPAPAAESAPSRGRIAGVAAASAEAPPATPDAVDDAREASALRAIEEGRYVEARELLGTILVERELAVARARLEEGAPEDALLALDRGLALSPHDSGVLRTRVEACLALAEKGIAEGGSGLLIEGALADALETYRRIDAPGPQATLLAARAATLSGDAARAWRLAREGMSLLRAEPGARPELPLPAERIAAEAAFGAYVDARGAEGSGEDGGGTAAALFPEAREALSSWIGFDADDERAWGMLSDLFEWQGDLPECRVVLASALDRLVDSDVLHARLARVARKEGGVPASLAAFEELAAQEPDVAIHRWYLASERFELAIESLLAGEGEPEAFEAAEEDFRTCRELDPSYEQACTGYEIMARNGLGWCLFNADDPAGAERAFESMNELAERGMEWEIQGRLLSGVEGLSFVAGKWNDRQEWERAGDVFQRLHRFQPDEPTWANNAGFFYRDAGVELEMLGRRLCRAASDPERLSPELAEAAGLPDGLSGPELAEALALASDDAMHRARALLEQSAEAYLAAAQLAPEDVRVQNDTALVHVYYLHTSLEREHQRLLHCVEMAERQSADPDLDEDARWELENAWGDACENLGVYYANHVGDKGAAMTWFERAVAIGPEPRPLLSNFWIPYLRGERQVTEQEEAWVGTSWAQPCALAGGSR